MLCLLAEAYYSGEPRWRERAEDIRRNHELARPFSEMLRRLRNMVADWVRVRSFYLDGETAVLDGEGHLVDRISVLCRLCSNILVDSDESPLLHLRAQHRQEWRRVVR
jgi:hypothetical protein